MYERVAQAERRGRTKEGSLKEMVEERSGWRRVYRRGGGREERVEGSL